MISRSQKIAAKNIDGELARLRDIVADLSRELTSETCTPDSVQKLGQEIASAGTGVVYIATAWHKALVELATMKTKEQE